MNIVLLGFKKNVPLHRCHLANVTFHNKNLIFRDFIQYPDKPGKNGLRSIADQLTRHGLDLPSRPSPAVTG